MQKFIVEGPRMVEEALPYAKEILYTKEFPVLSKAKGLKIPCHKITEKQFKKLSKVVSPQGVLAYVQVSCDLSLQIGSLLVGCVDIQDPGNLGTIIRTADAVGAAGIVATKGCADPYNQKTIRATAGSIFRVPVVRTENIFETISEFKQKKFKVVAADSEGVEDYWLTDLTGNTLVLIGNEGAGLSKEILEAADIVVKIPIPGKAESLTAAVSASVIMYEALRQKNG